MGLIAVALLVIAFPFIGMLGLLWMAQLEQSLVKRTTEIARIKHEESQHLSHAA